MADRAYNISVNFKTSAQLEPIKQTQKALQDVAAAGKAAGDQATAGLKKIEDEAAKAAKKLREVKSSGSGGGGGSAGGGAGGGGDALCSMLGNFGGGLGSLMPMIDMGAAMEQAANLGRFIGKTLGQGAQDAFVKDINIKQALEEQLLDALSAIGVWTEGFDANLERIKRESAVLIRDQQQAYQQFKEQLWKSPDDSSTWLKQLADDLRMYKTELEAVVKLEEQRRKNTMSIQDMLKQDALDAIDQSGMSEAEKIRARQDVISTDERTRLEIRGQERESKAGRSSAEVAAAERDYQEKLDIANRRQQYVSDVVAGANTAIAAQEKDLEGSTPAQIEAFKKQQFKNITEQAGVTGLEYGKDQSAALKDVVNQVKEAEKRLNEAKIKDAAERRALAEEEQTDQQTTAARIRRGEQSADSRARALEEAGQKGDEPTASPEYNREGEDMVRQSLLEAAQKTGNAATKAEVEQLARAFADNNTTAAETQQLTQLIDQLKSTGTQAATALAGKLSEAMGVIAQNQQQFNAAMQNLDSRVKQLEANSSTQ